MSRVVPCRTRSPGIARRVFSPNRFPPARAQRSKVLGGVRACRGPLRQQRPAGKVVVSQRQAPTGSLQERFEREFLPWLKRRVHYLRRGECRPDQIEELFCQAVGLAWAAWVRCPGALEENERVDRLRPQVPGPIGWSLSTASSAGFTTAAGPRSSSWELRRTSGGHHGYLSLVGLTKALVAAAVAQGTPKEGRQRTYSRCGRDLSWVSEEGDCCRNRNPETHTESVLSLTPGGRFPAATSQFLRLSTRVSTSCVTRASELRPIQYGRGGVPYPPRVLSVPDQDQQRVTSWRRCRQLGA